MKLFNDNQVTLSKETPMILTGLPDTRKIRKTKFFRTVEGGMKLVRKGIAATAADDNGAINIWDDKFGFYRCERQVRFCTQSNGKFKTLKEVKTWLRTELPKIQ